MPDKEKIFNFYKLAVAVLGGIAFVFAAAGMNAKVFDWRFFLYIIFTLSIASQMTLHLPRSKVILSFSDSIIFLTFLLFGGKAAIFVAALEMLTHCLFLKYKGVSFTRFTILFNIGTTTISTAAAYCVWVFFSILTEVEPNLASNTYLVSTLGILALAQFFVSTFFVAFFYSLKTRVGTWKVWKEECYSSSLTQIFGAGLAGVVYKLLTSGNVAAVIVTLLVFAIVYFTFRRSVKELESSLDKAEQAERDKAEAERLRAEQAERYVGKLSLQLVKEEQISEALQRSKDAFEYAALHDSLTNLFNRSYLIKRLTSMLELGIQQSNRYFILFLDLKSFKNINDSLGHTIGDKVLRLVASRLLKTVHFDDTVARIGGDEFAIILNDLASPEEAEVYAQRIYQKLSSPFSVQGNRIFSQPNIGIAPLDAAYKTPEEILRDADIAMHHAKDNEIGVAVFNTEIRDRFLEKIKLESDLRFAIERQEFSMHYQPLVALGDGAIIGFEALLRWQHPRRGFIPPVEFIPIAEDSGLIIPITNWILRETTEQLATWQNISPAHRDLFVSVNISGKHLAQDGLVEEVKTVLQKSKIKPVCLKLEVTETVAMKNAEQTIVILHKLKEVGVKLSIDDFGTGYSSLSYLHRLPFDTLKIDRSFVSQLGERGENSEILQTIVSLAKNLKMLAIAEGIETENQLRILRDLDCGYAQGYLFSKPLPKDEMETQLYKKHFWFPQSFMPENIKDAESISDSPTKHQLAVY